MRHQSSGGALSRHARQATDVVVQSAKDMVVDNGPAWSAAIAYYALLSTVPVLLVIGIVVSFFVDPQWAVDRLTNTLGDFVPQTEGVIEDTVDRALASRGQIGLLAFISLLWSGTRVFDNLTRAMNVVFDVDDDYSPLQRLGIQIVMLLSVGVLFLIALGSGLLIEPAWEAVRGTPPEAGSVMTIVTWLTRGGLLLLAHYLLYRFVPRRQSDNRALIFGAACATLAFMLASIIFGAVISRYGNFEQLYGPLAVVMIVVVWVGIGAHITVLGGEIVSHVQEMVIEGKSADDVGRRHAERSPRQHQLEASLPSPEQIKQKVGG